MSGTTDRFWHLKPHLFRPVLDARSDVSPSCLSTDVDRALDIALRSLAVNQHGLAATEQARQLGATDRDLRRRRQSPDWEVITSKVLRLVGTAETFEQRCMAAVLDGAPGAVVSHTSAAALWQLPGFPKDEIHVSRLRGRSGRRTGLATLSQPRCLPNSHITVVEGITVTTVARTIFDLSRVVHARRTERALDNALARGLTTIRSLDTVVATLAEHGRGGSALMRELLSIRRFDYVPPESGVEARFLGILRSAGLPLPRRQADLGGDQWVGRVDFLYPELRLIIEIDSSIHHSTALDKAADDRRDRELEAAGFAVCRIRAIDVWHRPNAVVAKVRTARLAAA